MAGQVSARIERILLGCLQMEQTTHQLVNDIKELKAKIAKVEVTLISYVDWSCRFAQWSGNAKDVPSLIQIFTTRANIEGAEKIFLLNSDWERMPNYKTLWSRVQEC